jgi:hypothetical protein
MDHAASTEKDIAVNIFFLGLYFLRRFNADKETNNKQRQSDYRNPNRRWRRLILGDRHCIYPVLA